MRGQAWIAFRDISSATRALQNSNQFLLYDRPMVYLSLHMFLLYLSSCLAMYLLSLFIRALPFYMAHVFSLAYFSRAFIPNIPVLLLLTGLDTAYASFVLFSFFPFVAQQKLSYSKNKSNAVAKMDGTYGKKQTATDSVSELKKKVEGI